MSCIPGIEYRMVPNMAPSVFHGRKCRTIHRKRAALDKYMKLLNQMQQIPEYAKRLYMNIAYTQVVMC